MPAAAGLRSAYNGALAQLETGMFAVAATQSTTKAGQYEDLAEQARGLQRSKLSREPIEFKDENLEGTTQPHDDALIVTSRI